MEDNLRILLKSIPAIEKGNRMVLGIDGLSRSGKTTFVNKLCYSFQEKNVSLCVFHMDDHIVESKKRYNTEHEEWYEYYNLQWNVEWLRENMFKKLRGSNNLNLPFYDNDSDVHSILNIQIPDSCVILVERVFLQRQEWRDYYDYLVYLDCDRDVRFSPLKKTSKSLETDIGKQKIII